MEGNFQIIILKDNVMRKIIIHQLFFTNSKCYKANIRQQPKGIQVHSTGATNSYLKRYVGPDDGLLGKNEYNNTHNNPNGTVCANAYIGRLNDGTPAIYQTLPWDMRCWLSANGDKGNANNLGYIGFEICEDNRKNRDYFEQVVMGLSVNLVAYLCKKFNIPIDKVRDHQELHKMGIASNHGDITWWLDNFQISMNSYRSAVLQAMAEGVQVTYVANGKIIEVDGDKEEEGEGGSETAMNGIVFAENGKPVNLRREPATSTPALTRVNVGETVEILGESDDKKWYRVKYKSIIGYMMKEFVHKEDNRTQQEKLIELKGVLQEAIELIDSILNS